LIDTWGTRNFSIPNTACGCNLTQKPPPHHRNSLPQISFNSLVDVPVGIQRVRHHLRQGNAKLLTTSYHQPTASDKRVITRCSSPVAPPASCRTEVRTSRYCLLFYHNRNPSFPRSNALDRL